MEKIKVLIVEDEKSIVDFLKIGLEIEGYKVFYSLTGQDSIKVFMENEINLIILDIMLPDIDGFDLCKIFKKLNNDIPIIMLTAKKETKEKVKGLDSGADDYITKPFEFEELVARIRANLRKYFKQHSNIIEIKNFKLNLDTHELEIDDKKIILTQKEFTIMKIFMRNQGKIVTKEFLVNRVYGYDYNGNENVIEVHINHLRKKIGDKNHKIIRTCYGEGYLFKIS